jgi:4-amino-4-deoxy-L-arabinose transferase-like glycosyltransferase
MTDVAPVEAPTEDPTATTPEDSPPRRRRVPAFFAWPLVVLPLVAIVAVGAVVRLLNFNAIGYNSDEAVYAGQGASIAHDVTLAPFFPVFRAHPLLFQSVVSLGYQMGWGDWWGRFASVLFGLATIILIFELGRLLYGTRAGIVAAGILALMPYHVVVTRQVLLDGPQTFFVTLTLYLLARYADSKRVHWLYAAGSAMGLAVLAKEPSVLFCGGIYAFFALAPAVRIKIRHFLGAGVVMAITIIPFPLAIAFSGKPKSGGNFLAWQLFRRPNHSLLFYPTAVPMAIGLAVVAAAVVALVIVRRRRLWSWRETLLVCWIIVPAAFFELWPVKGFQYLLPVAPAVAILAARLFTLDLRAPRRLAHRVRLFSVGRGVALGVLFVTLALPAVAITRTSTRQTFLAGSGGVPGGREMGRWIQSNVPQGSSLLAIGPSMANLVSFYGHRKAYGLSVSSNPLRRNPSYEPVGNANDRIRQSDLQYVVWDAYSAARTTFFARQIMGYVNTFHGRAIYTYTVPVQRGGRSVDVPVIRIYQVRPK